MKKSLFKILLSLFVVLALSIISLNEVNATSNTTIEYNFKELSTLDDFQAIYTTASNGGFVQNVEFDDYWTLDGNGLTSINPTISNGSTDNISYLSLTKYVFTNFEAEFVGNFLFTNSWGWMGLVYRQESVGRGFFDEGAFAGVQSEGTALIWGSNQQGSGPFEGNKPGSNAQDDKLVKVRVVNKEVSVTVYDMEGNVLSSISNTIDSRVAIKGYVSLASVDNHHNFSSFKITNLDESGNPTSLSLAPKMEQIEVLNKPTSLDINQTVTLNYNITPEDETYSKIKVLSSDTSVVIASGNSLTAIGTGTAEIKVYSALDSKNYDTFTVNVSTKVASDGKLGFVMNSLESLNEFTHNYVPDASGMNAGNYEDFSKYWSYSEEYKGVVRTNDQSSDPANDIVSFFVKDKVFTNYEMTIVYQNTNQNDGWIGFVGLHTVDEKRFMDNGFGAFIQSEGYPTIWGQDTGIHEKTDVVYDKTAIHILRVKVYGDFIELYLDDMNTAVLSYQIGEGKLNAGGAIGVFCSGAGYVIKSFTYAYLNKDGSLNQYFPVTDFTVSNVPTTAKVGEKYEIETTINSNATSQNVVMKTSDSNVCIAKKGKLVFIGSGVVVITIYPEDNPDLAKEYLIIVEDEIIEPEVDETPNPNDNESQNPQEPEKNGCSGSVVPTFIALTILLGAVLLLVSKKKTVRG